MKGIHGTDVEAGGYGEKWKNESGSSNESFTANDVIEAYESDAKDGEKRLLERITSLIHKKTVLAMEICEQIWLYLDEHGFEPISLHLKRNDIAAYSALCVVREEKYLSEEFGEVYEFVFSLVDKVNTNEYHLGIHFLPFSESYNKEMVLADGFVYSYNAA
jgi:hypothetical protein